MNRTGWTVLAVAGVLVIVVFVFEMLTRDAARTAPGPQDAGLSSPSLQPELPAPGTKAELSGPEALAAGDADTSVPDAGGEGEGTTEPGQQSPRDAGVRPGVSVGEPDEDSVDRLRTIEVILYFVRPDGQGLSPEPVAIFATSALLDRLKQTVAALIRGPAPDSSLAPSLPARTPLRDVFLDSRGTLYVDFGQELVSGLATGSGTEIHAAASLANTLILNFAEVRGVRMLAMGDDIETLGGHLDLTRTLTVNRGLIRPWTAPPDEWWSDRLLGRMVESGTIETDRQK